MSTGLAPAARGYTFQDAIGGVEILSVLFEESEAVAIEDAFQSGDKFDDLILEQDSDQICFQVKNRPGQRLTSSDLENTSSKFYLDDFVDSAQERIAAEELMSHTMQRLRRLFWPYEDRIQVWGKLADT